LDVFKLWISHGIRPSDRSYRYIVVPATTVDELEQNTSRNNINILSNTTEIQAVKHTGLQMCQAIFYKGGDIQVTDQLNLKCYCPGIVLLRAEGNRITQISVSDPNRELSKIHLSVTAKIEKSGDKFQAVWNEEDGVTEFAIELPRDNYAGQSVTIYF